MPSRTAIAIDVGRHRLRALLAYRDGGILRLEKTVIEDVPKDISTDAPEAIGEWLGRTLRDAGFPCNFWTKAVFALAREHVVLKRINLPTDDENELPEMTRLAMGRELPFDAQSAVIDFTSVSRTENRTTVLALAVKQDALDHALRIAKAAKIGVERVSVRGLGSALLLRHLGEETRKSILAVDIIGESIEFCVVEDGAIKFSRSAEAYPSSWQSIERAVDTVITETRRTWMSYRIAEDSSEVKHVTVMGDRRIAREAAGPLGNMLSAQGEVLTAHPLVHPGAASVHDLDRLWPLAGLLLEPSHGGPAIDFAHPRKAPDLAAARRKRVLMMAGVFVLLALGAWTLGKQSLSGLEAKVETARAAATSLYPQYVRHGREGYRLEHIRAWESAQADWLEHLKYLSTIAPHVPGRGEIVLDNWVGRLGFEGVTFNRSNQTWSSHKHVAIDVSGEAIDRATADRFRDALVRTDVYTTRSVTADSPGGRRLPHGFSYSLRSQTSQPLSDANDAQRRVDGGQRGAAP